MRILSLAVRSFALTLLAALASACSHVEISGSGNTSAASGATGLQVQGGSRSLATAIVVMGIAAGAVEYSREERSFPSSSALLPEYTPPAPEMAPDRRISEQDCTRPLDLSSGNLRCR